MANPESQQQASEWLTNQFGEVIVTRIDAGSAGDLAVAQRAIRESLSRAADEAWKIAKAGCTSLGELDPNFYPPDDD